MSELENIHKQIFDIKTLGETIANIALHAYAPDTPAETRRVAAEQYRELASARFKMIAIVMDQITGLGLLTEADLDRGAKR